MQLLLIGSDADQAGWLAERLSGSGFVGRSAVSAEAALQQKLTDHALAALVDSGRTNVAPLRQVRTLRDAGASLPVIVLSAHGEWREKVECLDAGADDFLVKPVRSEEIAARLRAVIRRSKGNLTDLFQFGDILIDHKRQCAWLGGECLDLTRNEFRLLRLFSLRADQVLSQAEILAALHPDGNERSANAAEVLVSRLRGKLGHDRIRTVRGIGYRILPTEGAAMDPNAIPPCCKGPCAP